MLLLLDLPEELLNEIVDYVHTASPTALTEVSFTCRRLHRLSQSFQWKHVVLPWGLNRNSPVASFIHKQRGNTDIKSITLQPQRSVLNAFRVRMEHAFDHLHALCNCLASLSKLNTFSICLDNQVDSRCYLPGPVLARIVRALPPSVVHLELDTEGIDRGWEHNPAENPAQHLCLAINDRMQNLESLRLRLSAVCTDLFLSAAPSNLRRAYLRIDISPNRENHLGTPVNVHDCRNKSPHLGSTMVGSLKNYGALKTKDFFNHLLELQALGTFPRLERFIVYSWFMEHEPDTHMHIQDVATRTVTRYPRSWRANERDYIIRIHDNMEYRGDRKEVEAAVLHEVSWIQLPTGTRLPPDVRISDVEPRLATEKLLPNASLQRQRNEMSAEHVISTEHTTDWVGAKLDGIIVDYF
jgi:hypothetical protein